MRLREDRRWRPDVTARHEAAAGIVLTAVAGYVDAVGFLRLRGVFVSFMSGNSTHLAIALSRGALRESAKDFGVVLLFVAGVVGGRLVGKVAGGKRRLAVLCAEAALLAAGVLSRLHVGAIAPVVFAMGLQNDALHDPRGDNRSLTYVTGTLVRFGEDLADALTGTSKRFALHATRWVALCAGAVLGALAEPRYGLVALTVPIAVVLLVAALEWRRD